MTLTAISDTVFSCARTINTTMQTVPYAGRAWVYARDNIVLPGAALAVAIWSAGMARISHAANWVLPTIAVGVTAAILLVVLALLHRRRRMPIHLLTPHQQELKKADEALAAQGKEVQRLRDEWDKARVKDQAVPANKTATQQAEAAHRAADTIRNTLYWEFQAAKRKAGSI
jgi:hypothetical protein